MPRILCVDAVGARIGIELDGADAAAVEAVERAWADAVSAGDAAPDATVSLRDADLATTLEHLSQQVTLAAIEAGRGGAWMLHAAGLAGDSGDVVVLVGPSGRGKTTASRTLGRVFGYVSDETIAIEASGRVRAYRKPLSVIEEPTRPKVQVAPTEAGLAPLPDAPLRVRAIVLLERDPAHGGAPVLEPVELGDALQELVAQTSFLTHAEAPLRFIAAVAEATGGVRRVTYAEAADLVPVVADLLTRGPAPAEIAVAEATRSDPRGSADDAQPGPARYSRGAWVDHIELDDPDRIAILTTSDTGSGTVRIIAGVAPAIWRAADAATLDDLVAAAIAAYGAPEGQDPRPVVLLAVAALMDAGILTSDEPLVQRRDDVAWVDRDDQVYALALGDLSSQPRLLADTAAVIWDWLESPSTVTQLAARATEESGVLDAQVAADVEAFVADLMDCLFVEEVEDEQVATGE